MTEQAFSVLLLAAGKATRFKSEHSKLLHHVAGRPLGEYLVRTVLAAAPERAYLVIGHGAEGLRKAFARFGLTFIEQKEQLGTGHALMIAREEIERCPSPTLVVLVGDAPLLRSETIRALIETHSQLGAAATVLSTVVENPAGYGRIIRTRAPAGRRVAGPGSRTAGTGHDRNALQEGSAALIRAIVEEKVCTPAQKKIREISSGILCFSRLRLLERLGELTADNAQREYLLTDLVEIFNRHREKVAALPVADGLEVLGVNDRVDLARVGKILRLRKAESLMREGVTIVDPEVTYIDDDVQAGADTVIEPGVSLLGATRLGRACLIQSYSTLADSIVGDRVIVRHGSYVVNSQLADRVTVGPFAHIREGSLIEQGARIGNFVEVKKSRVGQGSKALHLTYLGDAVLEQKVNIGAGTITCNYDGEKKHTTVVEEGSFIGSGTMLVAPLRVGKNSYVAAGSTITDDVPAGSLALGRARQTNKEGWTAKRGKPQQTAGAQKAQDEPSVTKTPKEPPASPDEAGAVSSLGEAHDPESGK
jgi:bifunctional UDP-N-acetylglucosamine pyrophosphorylase / glucosamine-1-phosphate N-acetyltransferase